MGTHWQNIVFEVLKNHEPELYSKIHSWVLEKYAQEGKSNEEIFGKNAKFALKEFYDDLKNIKDETIQALESKAYADTISFFKAFGSLGMGNQIK